MSGATCQPTRLRVSPARVNSTQSPPLSVRVRGAAGRPTFLMTSETP